MTIRLQFRTSGGLRPRLSAFKRMLVPSTSVAWLALVTLASSRATTAASFDCSKAASRVELLVCSNPSVSDLDTNLAAAYQALLGSAGSGAAIVRGQQREWLQARNACGTSECLKEHYAKRLAELNEFSRPAASASWEPMNVINLTLPNGQRYYTSFMARTSLRKFGKLRSIWTLTNYTEAQSFRNEGYDFIEYRSIKTLEYYDCERSKMADAREETFSGDMGSGELVRSDVYSTSIGNLRWEKFDLKGQISSRVRLVCVL